MKHYKFTSRLCILLALMMFATDAMAQKRKKTRRSKRTKVVVVEKKNKPTIVPLDSIIGKAYMGKVGRTVVDFFGTRKTYGDVYQHIYIWRDSIAVINKTGGDMNEYHFLPYSLKDATLTIGSYKYTTIKNGASIELNKMTENDEERKGELQSVPTKNISDALFMHGKYLDRMTIQTDEDKVNARYALSMAADAGNIEAQQYLQSYYDKRVSAGDVSAIVHQLKQALSNGKNEEAHKYYDMLIDLQPENYQLLYEKACLYIEEGKLSAAKKLLRKLKKKDAELYELLNKKLEQP